jgi:hypothetical protein
MLEVHWETHMLRHARLLTLAGVCLAGLALPLSTLTVSAATTATSTDTLTLSAGSLSVAAYAAGTATGVLGNGSTTTNIAVADWGDTTGSGAGWNGTVAVGLFNHTGAWTRTGGTSAQTTTTSGTYTGAATQGYYLVTVSADTGTNITAAVSGSESAPAITAQLKTSPIAVGTMGVTIKFDPAVTYVNGDQYTIHVGNLPASALVLGAGTSATGIGTTSATAPTFANNGSTVTGGSAIAVGSGVKFVSAALNTGMGSFRVTPSGTIAFDGNLDWAGTYVAMVSYSIVTGP